MQCSDRGFYVYDILFRFLSQMSALSQISRYLGMPVM